MQKQFLTPEEKLEKTNKEGTKFSPNKTYKWEQDTLFPLSGPEFGIMYASIREFLSIPLSPIGILKINDAFAILQNKLKESVEKGESTEYIPEPLSKLPDNVDDSHKMD